MKKSFFITLLFSPILLIADDLIVDKNSINQYEQNNFIVFDPFNDDGSSFCGNIRPPHGSPYGCDRVQFNDDFPIIGSNFTIELWAYSDSSSVLHRELIGIGEAPQHDFNRPPRPPTITFNYGRQIRYGYGTDGPNSQSRTFIVENVRTENSWNHIAFTFDGERTKLFVNGENVHISQDLSGDLPTQIPIKYLGKGFYGKIDELRIWNYARSRNEILQNMNVQLNGDEEGLLAYYPMDTDENWRIIDKTDNENHAELSDASISSRFYSEDCGFADGSYECPFPTINSALDFAKGGNRILIKAGRYSEQISRWHKNHSFETSGPKIIIEGYPGENVILDGTVKLQTNWQLVNVNGHSIYKTSVNIDSISRAVQKPIHSIHGTFINDRYMIPAMEINIKNPTDQTYGNPLNPEPGTVWALGLDGPGSNYRTISVLDTLEEWVYNSDEQSLYLYPNNEFDPNNSEVRVRIRDKVLTLMHSDNFEFKNINFFAGSFSFYNSSFLTIENSKFSYSSDVGLSGNTLNVGTHTKFRNCIFEYINSRSAYSQQRTMFPTLENCLFRYNDWFQGTGNYPTIDRNYRDASTIGGSTWRYITVENSYTAGIFAGQRSLVEYARFENLYEECDCSGIQRNAVGTNFSTTRYIWKLYTRARNGIRFDSACAGTYADIHNVVSVGGKRGFRLKGDGHDAYHLLAYDNRRQDISLPDYKFCGLEGLGGNGEGNLNSHLKNSIAEGSLECNSPDCGDLNSNLNSSGIWYGRQLDENYPPAAYPHLELADPWAIKRQLSNDSLISQYGENPFNNNFQNYDFRPKKGSVLIDGGVVVPGINDGQNIDMNHEQLYPNQNRAYVGDAPDIGAYEYGDSVYWIPGFRYSYPSVPIPGDGATDVSMEYGLAFNYPWKTDYTGTAATVTVSGPGINRTETLQYPNNVVFETFLPGETYNWSVIVDNVSSDIWTFTVDDKIYPLNDRSVDINASDEMLIPYQNKSLQVSVNELSFLRFDIPKTVNVNNKIYLNITPDQIHSLSGGVVLYKYNYQGWGEKLNEKNIGVIDHSLLTPLKTFSSLSSGSELSIDVSEYIDSTGEYSFALGPSISTDNVSFYSKEKLVTDGVDISVLAGDLLGPSGNGSGYAPQVEVWPSLSFEDNE